MAISSRMASRSRHTTPQDMALLPSAESLDGMLSNHMRSYSIAASSNLSDRRVTEICWHPTRSNYITAAHKSGEVVLWDYTTSTDKWILPVHRANIYAMGFHPTDPAVVFTVGDDRTLRRTDIETSESMTATNMVNSTHKHHWFGSLDVGKDHVLGGDTQGYIHGVDVNGTRLWTPIRLQKKKLACIHFNPVASNLVAVGCNDHRVYLYDTRTRGQDEWNPISSVDVGTIPNSARFSPLTGSRLLTTTQGAGPKVASRVLVHDVTAITLGEKLPESSFPVTTGVHPHRFFQYLTPFRAHWHPHDEDTFAVGRYEDNAATRDIDIVDVNTLQVKASINDPRVHVMAPVVVFDPHTGDSIASGSGHATVIWKPRKVVNSTRARDLPELPANLLSKRKSGTSRAAAAAANGNGTVALDTQRSLTNRRRSSNLGRRRPSNAAAPDDDDDDITRAKKRNRAATAARAAKGKSSTSASPKKRNTRTSTTTTTATTTTATTTATARRSSSRTPSTVGSKRKSRGPSPLTRVISLSSGEEEEPDVTELTSSSEDDVDDGDDDASESSDDDDPDAEFKASRKAKLNKLSQEYSFRPSRSSTRAAAKGVSYIELSDDDEDEDNDFEDDSPPRKRRKQ